MQILTTYKPEKCVSKDKENIVLRQLFLEKTNEEKGVLNASDGKMLVRIPVDLAPGDCEGGVPTDCLILARKVSKDGIASMRLSSMCEIETPEIKSEFARFNYLTFPKFQNTIPKGKPKAYIAFNVKLLKAISDALGDEVVVLEIRGTDQGIVVRPSSNDLSIGVLMPVKTSREFPRDDQKEL